jgi:hypothetical protein
MDRILNFFARTWDWFWTFEIPLPATVAPIQTPARGAVCGKCYSQNLFESVYGTRCLECGNLVERDASPARQVDNLEDAYANTWACVAGRELLGRGDDSPETGLELKRASSLDAFKRGLNATGRPPASRTGVVFNLDNPDDGLAKWEEARRNGAPVVLNLDPSKNTVPRKP